MTREDFLNSENLLVVRENNSNITYYMGEAAAVGLQGDKLKELEDKDATFIQDAVGKEITEFVFDKLGTKGSIVNELINWGEYYNENKENKRNIKIGEAHKAAMTLDMEIEIIERQVPYEGTDYRVEIIPTDLTYDILENWKKAYEKYPELPIPLEAIEEQNWYEIAKSFSENQMEIRENFGNDVYRDIFGGNN